MSNTGSEYHLDRSLVLLLFMIEGRYYTLGTEAEEHTRGNFSRFGQAQWYYYRGAGVYSPAPFACGAINHIYSSRGAVIIVNEIIYEYIHVCIHTVRKTRVTILKTHRR